MKKTKLARAVRLALTTGVLSLGAVSNASAVSTTMYNLSTGLGSDNSTNTIDPTAGGVWGENLNGGTDGWANGAYWQTKTIGSIAAQKWAGTGGQTSAPFGYTGAHMNWGLEFTGNTGNTAEISTFDAFAKYGVYADIDTAKGAWSDANAFKPSAVGWGHNLDTGLFRTDVSGTVTLELQGILQSGTNFGFTVFKGMDAMTRYAHHSAWNAGNNQDGITDDSTPYTIDFDLGTLLPITDIVAYSVGGANPVNLNTISFDAEAGQIYTIFLGGYRNGSWGATDDGYRLTVSQVPVPGALWLFGSAVLGLIGVHRKRSSNF
ncbi:hypothetical protein IVG45_11410 [Methylomonas sp. LL1]|uniref:hypothetical protein n=1 Tax=Methylomonas sp. LL1 TaxID=2785785 RepID=UPI0018C394EA|nr:hypothetical protein [Methylomonas sp. LL1]QPK61511.1 hypothetical protein IVG45_11410 [Methylomonas sp. LL1]